MIDHSKVNSDPIPICFLGTPKFAEVCLRGLLADSRFRVVAVVSQPDRPAGRKLELTPSPVKQLALQHGLPVFTPEKASAADFLSVVQGWGARAAVVVAYGQILSEKFLASFPLGAVNVHGSLLPRWRGAAPIQRAIESGDPETGVCLQKMVKELDAGDVLGERRWPLNKEMNAVELHDFMADKAVELLRQEFHEFCLGRIEGKPQDPSLVTYAKKLLKTESHLDWSRPALEIHNKVRAFVLGPGTYAVLGEKKVKIHRTRVVAEGEVSGRSAAPGSVVSVTPDSLHVKTGEGVLELLEVQPESRPKMSIKQFLSGHDVKVGDRLL